MKSALKGHGALFNKLGLSGRDGKSVADKTSPQADTNESMPAETPEKAARLLGRTPTTASTTTSSAARTKFTPMSAMSPRSPAPLNTASTGTRFSGSSKRHRTSNTQEDIDHKERLDTVNKRIAQGTGEQGQPLFFTDDNPTVRDNEQRPAIPAQKDAGNQMQHVQPPPALTRAPLNNAHQQDPRYVQPVSQPASIHTNQDVPHANQKRTGDHWNSTNTDRSRLLIPDPLRSPLLELGNVHQHLMRYTRPYDVGSMHASTADNFQSLDRAISGEHTMIVPLAYEDAGILPLSRSQELWPLPDDTYYPAPINDVLSSLVSLDSRCRPDIMKVFVEQNGERLQAMQQALQFLFQYMKTNPNKDYRLLVDTLNGHIRQAIADAWDEASISSNSPPESEEQQAQDAASATQPREETRQAVHEREPQTGPQSPTQRAALDGFRSAPLPQRNTRFLLGGPADDVRNHSTQNTNDSGNGSPRTRTNAGQGRHVDAGHAVAPTNRYSQESFQSEPQMFPMSGPNSARHSPERPGLAHTQHRNSDYVNGADMAVDVRGRQNTGVPATNSSAYWQRLQQQPHQTPLPLNSSNLRQHTLQQSSQQCQPQSQFHQTEPAYYQQRQPARYMLPGPPPIMPQQNSAVSQQPVGMSQQPPNVPAQPLQIPQQAVQQSQYVVQQHSQMYQQPQAGQFQTLQQDVQGPCLQQPQSGQIRVSQQNLQGLQNQQSQHMPGLNVAHRNEVGEPEQGRLHAQPNHSARHYQVNNGYRWLHYNIRSQHTLQAPDPPPLQQVQQDIPRAPAFDRQPNYVHSPGPAQVPDQRNVHPAYRPER